MGTIITAGLCTVPVLSPRETYTILLQPVAEFRGMAGFFSMNQRVSIYIPNPRDNQLLDYILVYRV